MTEILKVLLLEDVVRVFGYKEEFRVLKVDIYADNTQGTVLAFDGTFCWKYSYSINPDTLKLTYLNFLSGILDLYSRDTESEVQKDEI